VVGARVNRVPAFSRAVLLAFLALPGPLILAACSDTPAQPTPPPAAAPSLSCPASVSVTSPSGEAFPVSYPPATVTGGTAPTTLTCAPPSGSTFQIGATAVTCTLTDQVGRTATCGFSVTVTAPPRLARTRFLAFGDSITWGEDGRISSSALAAPTLRPRVQFPIAETYPGALSGLLSARYTAQSPTILNAGKPGEAVTDPTTFPRYVSYTSSRAYDVVLLMEGANDLAKHGFSEIIAGLNQMIGDAQSRQMQVLLATIPPENPDQLSQAASVGPFNDRVRDLAASKGVPLVDVYQAFNGQLSLLGSDGLHPTAAGYDLIAETFFAAIKQNLEAAPTATTGLNPARVKPASALPRRLR
jgi:lysophospholipase L1-like esterase